MDIRIKLTLEELDRFRAIEKDYTALKKRHEELCNAVLDGLSMDGWITSGTTEHYEKISITDTTAAAKAIDIAADWPFGALPAETERSNT